MPKKAVPAVIKVPLLDVALGNFTERAPHVALYEFEYGCGAPASALHSYLFSEIVVNKLLREVTVVWKVIGRGTLYLRV